MNMNKDGEYRTIGVIGGMGPMASQLFYKMVIEKTASDTDQGHVKMVILNDTDVPDRTQAIKDKNYGVITERLAEDAQILEKLGCSAIAVPCNTSHFFLDMVSERVGIPFIHMIRETAARAAELPGIRKAAVLATDGTIRTGLYQRELEKAGIEPYCLSEDRQADLMFVIYERIKKGLPYDAEKWAAIENEFRDAGCSIAILACTELSVINADNDLTPGIYLDAMGVLAEKTITFSGHELRQNT